MIESPLSSNDTNDRLINWIIEIIKAVSDNGDAELKKTLDVFVSQLMDFKKKVEAEA